MKCLECGFENAQTDICSACNAALPGGATDLRERTTDTAARAIVERLAAMDEPLYDTGYGDTDCALCSAHRPYDAHDKDCPWQAARDLITAQERDLR